MALLAIRPALYLGRGNHGERTDERGLDSDSDGGFAAGDTHAIIKAYRSSAVKMGEMQGVWRGGQCELVPQVLTSVQGAAESIRLPETV